MQVKSIAECSKGSILQYFRPSLSYHVSLRPLFCLFLGGDLRQVSLYTLSIDHFKQSLSNLSLFSFPFILTYVLICAQKYSFIEMLLLSTQNMFCVRNKENNFSITHSYLPACIKLLLKAQVLNYTHQYTHC